MKNIMVMPKREFDSTMRNNNIINENVEKFTHMAMISINDTVGYSSVPHFSEDYSNVLTLQFDDVTKDGEPAPTNTESTKAIDDEQARKIVDFIENNTDKSSFLIHCAAGISRSGAVGMFVASYFDVVENFKRMNGHIIPNEFIYNKILNSLRNKKLNS